ncbi:MAG: histidine phosphatase family protein, partial [Gammaproteobacteria bacterium]|nr:histidine phosphatase family protein [Gammaproteobacteria bacterium]
MKTLLLLRHAKSSWDDPSLEDFDRPLAPRGEKAAPVMAAYLASKGLRPDLVLCSPAARARQTWALVAQSLGDGIAVKELQSLY